VYPLISYRTGWKYATGVSANYEKCQVGTRKLYWEWVDVKGKGVVEKFKSYIEKVKCFQEGLEYRTSCYCIN
jgi:hypothetical protein